MAIEQEWLVVELLEETQRGRIRWLEMVHGAYQAHYINNHVRIRVRISATRDPECPDDDELYNYELAVLDDDGKLIDNFTFEELGGPPPSSNWETDCPDWQYVWGYWHEKMRVLYELARRKAETPNRGQPLLDLSDATIANVIRTAKKRGYVTHEQVNSLLPPAEVSSEQIEDVIAMFSEMGVNVVETRPPRHGRS
jgi:hypothetical protein